MTSVAKTREPAREKQISINCNVIRPRFNSTLVVTDPRETCGAKGAERIAGSKIATFEKLSKERAVTIFFLWVRWADVNVVISAVRMTVPATGVLSYRSTMRVSIAAEKNESTGRKLIKHFKYPRPQLFVSRTFRVSLRVTVDVNKNLLIGPFNKTR